MAASTFFQSESVIDSDWQRWRSLWIVLASANVADPSTGARQAQDLAKWAKYGIFPRSSVIVKQQTQVFSWCEYGRGGKCCSFDTIWIMDLSRVCAPATRTPRPGAAETHSSVLPQEANRSSESMAGASNGDPRRTKARNAGDPGEQRIRRPDRWVSEKDFVFTCALR